MKVDEHLLQISKLFWNLDHPDSEKKTICCFGVLGPKIKVVINLKFYIIFLKEKQKTVRLLDSMVTLLLTDEEIPDYNSDSVLGFFSSVICCLQRRHMLLLATDQ